MCFNISYIPMWYCISLICTSTEVYVMRVDIVKYIYTTSIMAMLLTKFQITPEIPKAPNICRFSTAWPSVMNHVCLSGTAAQYLVSMIALTSSQMSVVSMIAWLQREQLFPVLACLDGPVLAC